MFSRVGFPSRSQRASKTRQARSMQRAANAAAYRAAPRFLLAAAEKKQYTLSLLSNFNSITTAGRDQLVTGITTGGENFQRIGNRISIHSIELKGVLVGGQTGTSADDNVNIVRLILGVWKAGWTSPVVNWISSVPSAMNQPLNKQSLFAGSKIQKKLLDQYISLPVQVALSAGYAQNPVPVSFFHRFKTPLRMEYPDGGTAAADLAIYLSAISDSTTIPSPGFSQGYILVTYTDV